MLKPSFLTLAAIATIPFVITLGNSMLIPVLPIMERELNISTFQSSMIITVYSIVAVVFIPLAGVLSDRIGRKKVIIPSLAVAGIGGLVAGVVSVYLSNPFPFILAGRLLQGIGAAGAFPIVLPLVGDVFDDEKDISHGLGVVETANTLGKVLSPVLGAFFASVLWYIPFFTIPLFSLASLLMIAFWVDNSKSQEKPMTSGRFVRLLKTVFKTEGKWLTAIFLSGGIIMTNLFGFLFYLSKILEDTYQITGIQKGLVLAIPLANLCLASYLSGKFIGKEKIIMRWTAFGGLSLLTLSSLGLILTDQLVSLIAVLSISGIGIGVCLPSLDALITETIEKEQRGTITSLYSGMRYAGVAIGPPLFAVLMDHSALALFLVGSALGAVASILVFTLIRP